MINSLDMKEVSKISYNADTRKEVFRFDIIYRDGRTESKEIPLYVFDLEANKKVVNSEAINIANFVTESSKKINAANDKKVEPTKEENKKEDVPSNTEETIEQMAVTPVKTEVKVTQPFSERKLDTLNNILKAKVRAELSDEELQSELQKLSRQYDVSSKSMEVLYQKAQLEVQKDNAEAIARKKLTGRKIPSKFQARKNEKIEVTDIRKQSLYNRKSYIERSKDLVIPEFKEDWIRYINENHRQPVHIYGAVDIMVMINNGTNIREIHKYLDNLHNSISNASMALDLLEKYSPYGKELSKKCRKYRMSRPERLKNFVLDKTSLFVEKVDEKDSNQAIEELKALRSSLKEMSEIQLTTLTEENSKTM